MNSTPRWPAPGVNALLERGVRVLDPAQTYVGDDVDASRIAPTAVLFPGTRLSGPRTYLGPDSSVGAEGPAVLVDAVLGAGAAVASGYVRGAVLLRGACLGANAHVREGTLLEEEASTAHCVGLKQTILLSFVTLGSLINFCDVLMAGGTSRQDHSEVGSGFIHFNFTPWGRRGDKATASLVGDVVDGVFLRSGRIFLGGSGGMVGPACVGYGSIAAAGQVVRRDLDPERLVLQPVKPLDVPAVEPGEQRVERVWRRNARFIGQLAALREWYRQVRLARAELGPGGEPARIPLLEAMGVIDVCLGERVKRLDSFLRERGRKLPLLGAGPHESSPLGSALAAGPADHVEWVRSLAEAHVEAGRAWLQRVASRVEREMGP
ncbi:MAG: UDP-N-acetylglucosamine pyrophosphorylase [Planctomycetes bacterium]|nr:UDP-N-acetylglucosamine pyrophosphorylase [Planctomycetota bacterium]